MSRCAYVITTPGIDLDSFVRRGKRGKTEDVLYVKIGDASQEKPDYGIRDAYMTHNPDIGIFAVIKCPNIADPHLATRIKNYLDKDMGIDRVEGSEWFKFEHTTGWRLVVGLNNKYDNKTVVDLARINELLGDIKKLIGKK